VRTHAAAKESQAHAATPFFARQRAGTPAFFPAMVQAKCACHEEETLQRQVEAPPPVQAKCSACREEESRLQPKLTIGAPGDRYEVEADHMADAVMRSAAPGFATDARGATTIQRLPVTPVIADRLQRDAAETCSLKDEPKQAGEEENEETEDQESTGPESERQTTVSPKGATGDVSPPPNVESGIDASRGGGSPLPAGTREFMESRFDHDFSGVRVHTGSTSESLNRDVRSLAFTSGTDIYFGAGQYRPDTDSGQHLLAHELTHVVQQTGATASGGLVREKADPHVISRVPDLPEYKWYYSHRVSGTSVHHIIERILRENDPEKTLVTEAAIAGANRNGEALNKIGVADLYKSDPPLKVTGVKGFREVEKESDIVSMNNPEATGTQPTTVTPGPTFRSGTWSGDFPSHISLGEIKPWNTVKAADGWAQLDHYEQGYGKFVERIHDISGRSGHKTRSSIGVGRLDVTVPARLDFDQWDSQHATPSKDTTFGDRRMWIARVAPGIYLYTDFAQALRGPAPELFTVHLTKLRKVKEHITTPHPHTDKMGQGKFIQRETKDRPANYWPERAREWETERKDFATGFRGSLKGTLKDYREKVRFEKRLGRSTSRTQSAAEKKEVKEYKDLMFWSGLPGRILGKVRFLLGTAWDKALGIFEKMKEKMGGIRSKVKALKEGGLVKVGWANRLIQVVVAACKVAFSSFITESFNFFADCFHSAMDKLIDSFKEALNEKFGEEICRARKFFEGIKEELDSKWGGAIKDIEKLVEAVQDVKRWMDIATTAIDLIRVGVQVISCLSPPALGCLWGLVAQLGIGEMVGLVIGTQWFNDNIVTPNVRSLVRTHIGKYYQSLINDVLGENLKKYHCHIADDAIPSMNFTATGGLPNGSAALRAHRDAWEAENEPQMLKDLQEVFGKPGGKKVTKEELLELVKKIQDSKLSMEDLKNRKTMQELLEQSRDPASGTLNVDKAKQQAEKIEVPTAPATERKIDYPRARQQNVIYQKMRGWDPVTFVKKPGIKVDSDEFANAVYDMQEALRVKADGILGDDTLVAFYDRNKKRADTQYNEATKAIEEKKAAEAERKEKDKAAKDKAAADKVAKDKGGADKGGAVAPAAKLPASVKVLNAHQAIPDGKSHPFPKGVHIYIVDVFSLLTWTDNPRTYDVKSKPPFIAVDVFIDKTHEFRIEYVAVKELRVTRILAAAGGGFSEWELFLLMEDGVQVTTSRGVFSIQSTSWGLP
jgi:hypothetical protein